MNILSYFVRINWNVLLILLININEEVCLLCFGPINVCRKKEQKSSRAGLIVLSLLRNVTTGQGGWFVWLMEIQILWFT